VRIPRKDLRAAVELYSNFREKKPKRLKVVNIDIPTVTACIGHVEKIWYTTTHGKEAVLYEHPFAPGSRPLLAVSSDGRQLLLLGGRFKFTERGIVDRDADGKEIENPQHGRVLNPTNRERPTGRYAPDLSRICSCGHRLGQHLAEGKVSEAECTVPNCHCEGFRGHGRLDKQ
jgi:hypothetical protein